MKTTINGYECELTVAEFGEICRMELEAARQAQQQADIIDKATNELFGGEKTPTEIGNLRNLVTLRMPSGEYLYFAHVGDISAHFPELNGGYQDFGGIRSTDPADYVRKQARKLYDRLKPEHRFVEFQRYTTNNKCVTAKVSGGRITIEVTEAA